MQSAPCRFLFPLPQQLVKYMSTVISPSFHFKVAQCGIYSKTMTFITPPRDNGIHSSLSGKFLVLSDWSKGLQAICISAQQCLNFKVGSADGVAVTQHQITVGTVKNKINTYIWNFLHGDDFTYNQTPYIYICFTHNSAWWAAAAWVSSWPWDSLFSDIHHCRPVGEPFPFTVLIVRQQPPLKTAGTDLS